MSLTGPDIDALAAVAASAEQLHCTLGIARELVVAEKRVNLRELDEAAGYVCARALDLPPEQGRAFRATLIGLLREVDALSAALASHGAPDG